MRNWSTQRIPIKFYWTVSISLFKNQLNSSVNIHWTIRTSKPISTLLEKIWNLQELLEEHSTTHLSQLPRLSLVTIITLILSQLLQMSSTPGSFLIADFWSFLTHFQPLGGIKIKILDFHFLSFSSLNNLEKGCRVNLQYSKIRFRHCHPNL